MFWMMMTLPLSLAQIMYNADQNFSSARGKVKMPVRTVSKTLFYGFHILFFLQSGLRKGASEEVISDTHRVRTNPQVRVAGPGGWP